LGGIVGSAIAPRLQPAINEPHQADHHPGQNGRGQKGVGDAAMVLQFLHRPPQRPENVDVGGLCGQHRGQRGMSRLAVQPGAADAGSG
jgi:hypothetical protein